jgi:hypothetical protein
MAVYNPFDFFLEPSADNFPFKYEPAGRGAGALPRLRAAHAAGSGLPREDRPQAARTIDFLVALNQQVQQDVKYLIRMEPGVQTPEQTLELASGSCRDSGWLLVQLLRRHGPGGALRLRLPDPADARREGARRPERHRGRLHRPARLVRGLPARRRLDRPGPTSGLLAGEGHIPLACTPQPSGAAPIEGAGGRSRGRVRPPHAGHAHPRIAARDQALHRGAMGRGAGPGRCGRPRS